MITRTCNGCARLIARGDLHAARDVNVGEPQPVDWCGECVAIIKVELPRLAAQARDARRAAAAEPVRSRALTLWSGMPIGPRPKLQTPRT